MIYHEGSLPVQCYQQNCTDHSHCCLLAIMMENCSHLLLTIIHAEIPCDSFFPEIDESVFRKADHHELEAFAEEEVPRGRQEWQGLEYEFVMYVRR